MEKKNRLIIHYSRDNKIINIYNTIDGAAAATGIRKGFIISNLNGMMNDCADGTKFRYEVKATDLRKQNREEKERKEQEEIDRLWEELENDRH